jgi:hypothetical protein
MVLPKAKDLANTLALKNIFTHTHAASVCIIIAVVSKCVIVWAYTDLQSDKSLYLLFARGFLENGIFAEKLRLLENGKIIYQYNPAIISPFYSILAAPILWLTNSYFATQFIISAIGWVLFFTALAKVARVVFKEQWLVNAFILFSGFFLYPHELSSTPKDTLAAAFTLWIMYFVYRLALGDGGLRSSVLCALSIACLSLTKLLYLPAELFLVAFLFLITVKRGNRRSYLNLGRVLALLALIAGMVFLLVINPARHTTLVTLPTTPTVFIRGFYPQNLLRLYPFISSSFIDTSFVSIQIRNLTRLSYSTMIQAFQVVDLFLIIILLSFLLTHAGILKHQMVTMFFGVALALVSGTICLSLRYRMFYDNNDNTPWTYVAEARSFLLPMLALQILTFCFVFQSRTLPFVRGIVLVLLFLGVLHGVYFTAKQIAHLQQPGTINRSSSPVKEVISRVSQLQKTNGDFSLITSDETLRRYAEIKGFKPYAVVIGKPVNLPWMKKGSRFVVVTPLNDSTIRNGLQLPALKTVDTVRPFLLQTYTKD